jgi:hypothetical protein
VTSTLNISQLVDYTRDVNPDSIGSSRQRSLRGQDDSADDSRLVDVHSRRLLHEDRLQNVPRRSRLLLRTNPFVLLSQATCAITESDSHRSKGQLTDALKSTRCKDNPKEEL